MSSPNSGKIVKITGKVISNTLSEEMETKPQRKSVTDGGSLNFDNTHFHL